MNQIQVTCDKECIYRNDGFVNVISIYWMLQKNS